MIGEYTIRRSRKSIIPSIGFVLVFALLIANACLLVQGRPVAGSDNAEHETVIESVPDEPEEPVLSYARQITLRSSLPEDESRSLFDGSYWTDAVLKPGEVFRLEADDKIAALYIVWGTYPGEWELETGRSNYHGGLNNFLHEFILRLAEKWAGGEDLVISTADAAALKSLFATKAKALWKLRK